MRRKTLLLFVLISLIFLLSSSTGPMVTRAEAAYVTEITVDSTDDDYLDGKTKTCTANGPPCTLRRAINEAYSLGAAERPVLIRFNIPTSDPGYISSLKAWKIQLTGSTSYDLRELYGKTTINGATQPNGRTTGPKIIIDGQRTTGNMKNYGLILRQGENVVTGLAMQNFIKHHVSISSAGNIVQNCWFGLSDDGQFLSKGDEVTYEGGSGVVVNNYNTNIIRNNKFAGFFGTACSINGTGNVFTGNRVGMRADGTVPLPGTYTKHPCIRGTGELWVGGVGLTVAGSGNRIGGTTAERNFFAGLFLDLSETSTQSPAIKVSSGSNATIIKNNYIGVTPAGKNIGVCGRGLDLGSGSDYIQVLNNTISEPALSGILLNTWPEGVTIQQNVIKRQTQWPGAQPGNSFPEGAIAYGPTGTDPLKAFKPAAITSISVGTSGTLVTGTSGVGSSCPDCVVEVFLDDLDTVQECTLFKSHVTADGSGNWSTFFSTPLTALQGLRTMSTVPDGFTITGLKAGTTSNISQLYKVPKVKVVASDGTASEPGTNTGTFTFTRDAAWGPLTVTYTVATGAGNATPGSDYTALPGTVSFPAGVATKTVLVTPKNDTTHESDEKVTVTIVNKPTYDLWSPYTATVTIKDND